MTPAQVLTMLALLGRPIDGVETAEQWAERRSTIAEAVAAETRSREMAAAVLTVWQFEGSLRRDVHAGERRGDGGRAICLGQLHRSALTPQWESLAGLDIEATRRCARATVRALRAVWTACADSGGRTVDRARVLAAYGAGHCIAPPRWAHARATTWRRLAGS